MSERQRAFGLFIKNYIEPNVTRQSVLSAFKSVDRKQFLSEDSRYLAYNDTPVGIGVESSISQPSLSAKMINELEPQIDSTILEVGTGSGYITAVLAECSKNGIIHSFEYNPQIAKKAKERLESMGYKNIHLYTGDGLYGIPELKFDRVIITGATRQVPQRLLGQLKPEGIIIVPVAKGHWASSDLLKITKNDDVKIENIGKVSFYPITSQFGGFSD